MMGEMWTIKNELSLTAFCANVKALYEEHQYITYAKPRIGASRSVSQNALLHMWCTSYAAQLLQKESKSVSKGELAGMKRTAKGRYYQHSQHDFLVHTVIDPFTGQSKKDYTSSADWKKGELFGFLQWLQLIAANDGLLLESTGEFKKIAEEQNA